MKKLINFTLTCFLLSAIQICSQTPVSYFTMSKGMSDGSYVLESWGSTNDSAFIIDGDSSQSNPSFFIPSAYPENFVSLFLNSNNDKTPSEDKEVLFVDYYIKLTASDLPKLPALTNPVTTAMIAVQPHSDGFGEWFFLDGDNQGGGKWLASGNTVRLVSNQTSWHRITLRFNLVLGYWDIYIDGVLVAVNLGFAEKPSNGLEAINIYGNRSGNTYFRDFSLTDSNPLFEDADRDGIYDGYEKRNGMDVNSNDRNSDADFDGVINIEEFKDSSNPRLSRAFTAYSFSATEQATPPSSAAAIKFHEGVINDVNESWQIITLPSVYDSMVVVCTVNLPSLGSPPAVARVRGASGNSFQLKLQNPSGATFEPGYSVHYVVVEAGVYTLAEHGVKMEAVRVESTKVDSESYWFGQSMSYSNVYTNPVVLGQVMTTRDRGWSVFWACGLDRFSPPSNSALKVGMHVGESKVRARYLEALGYIVFEGGSGTIGDTGYTVGVGPSGIYGVDDGNGYDYPVTVQHSPDVAVVSAAAMKGNDGGWPVLYGANPVDSGKVRLAIDEDQIYDTERNHTAEQVAYLIAGKKINIPPKASDDTVSISKNTTVTVDVRANDTDVDSDPLTVTGVTPAANGTAAVNAGGANVTYTPNTDFIGTDIFTYTISDGKGGESTAKVTVNVLVSADGDYLPDEWEIKYFKDLDENNSGDPDGDGFNNLDEYRLNTNPVVSDSDTDSDDIPDLLETKFFGNLNENEFGDPDGDNFSNAFEIYNNSNPNDNSSIPTFGKSDAYFKVQRYFRTPENNKFRTINEAESISRYYNYAIIEVLPGKYNENVILSSSTSIFASEDPSFTVLYSENSKEALTIQNHVILDGLTINYDGDSPAIEINSSEEVIIRNCFIKSQGIELVSTLGSGISKSGGLVRLNNCYMPKAVD